MNFFLAIESNAHQTKWLPCESPVARDAENRVQGPVTFAVLEVGDFPQVGEMER